MKQVVIIGNSGAARECYWLLRDIADPVLGFRGFLSFEGYRGNLADLAQYELGVDDDYAPQAGDVFIIGIGQPELRLKAFAKWKARGVEFVNLVHPNARVAENAVMGEANIVANGTFVSCNTVFGNANFLNGFVIAGHDVHMGDGNFFGTFVQLLGEVQIGNANSFGASSVILPGAKIGDRNTIAPGAYLYKGCKNDCIMTGNPAHNVR